MQKNIESGYSGQEGLQFRAAGTQQY